MAQFSFFISPLKGLCAFALSCSVSLSVSADNQEHQPLDDTDVSIHSWGKQYPHHVDMYMQMKDSSKPTEFGGNVPYSKLIRFPQLQELWAGYAFSHDFNEERGHYYTQVDQWETGRNDKAFLHSKGAKKFKGQPGACMNCHSGWVPEMVREMGWENFNRTPYWDIVAHLEKKYGKGMDEARLGSTCAD